MSRVPSPADLAAAQQPLTAEQLRTEYRELIDESVPSSGDGQSGGQYVDKLERAHNLLQDALSERNG